MKRVSALLSLSILLLLSVTGNNAMQGEGNGADKWPTAQEMALGFRTLDYLLYAPEPKPGVKLSRGGLNLIDSLRLHRGYFEDTLVAYPCDVAAELYHDRCNDTVTIMWSGGRFQAIVNEIGVYNDVCVLGVYCSIKPLDSTVQVLPSFRDAFVVLRKGFEYDGPLVLYAEYDSQDSAFATVREVLSGRMMEIPRMREVWTAVYGVKSDTMPDTVFMSVRGWDGNSYGWLTVYRLVKNKGGWDYNMLIEPTKGDAGFEIECALDLNGDGRYEFLVRNSRGASVLGFDEDKPVQIKRVVHAGGC